MNEQGNCNDKFAKDSSFISNNKESGEGKIPADNDAGECPSTDKYGTNEPSAGKHSTNKPSAGKHSAYDPSADNPSADKPRDDKYSANEYSAAEHNANKHSANKHKDINIKDGGILRIHPITSCSFRIQYDRRGIFNGSALNRYNILCRKDEPTEYDITESPETVTLKTKDASITVETSAGSLTVFDNKGNVITHVEAPWKFEKEGFGVSIKMSDDEKIYGMGDTTRECLEKRGFMKKIWVANVTSYVPIPFLMSSRGFGILINTTWKHYIDVGNKKKDSLRFWGEHGSLDYYLFIGNNYGEILDRYTNIAGKPVMLPIWAYGLTFVCNQQANAREMLDDCLNMRREGIPCDVIGLEPGWMEKYYDCTTEKNWHPERFYIPPWAACSPNTFLKAAERLGYKLSLWLCCNYDLSFEEERRLGAKIESENSVNWEYHPDDFEKDANIGHDPIYMDKITKRGEPWFEHLKKFVDQGVSAFKLDGAYQVNEHPDRCWGNGMTDQEMHNLYPVILNKQMSLGYREHTGKRAMIYSAGGYTGIQQYSATWAGDTGGGPKPLVSMLNHGMSGHSNTSCDMDVFTPAGIHFGFLQTWSQICSWAYWRHPWLLGDELLPVFKYYAKLRYRLLPYIYSMAHIAASSGMPVMRAMPLAYPDDPASDRLLDHYMLGEGFLVAVFTNKIHLPEGEWIDFWTGEKYSGPLDFEYTIPKDRGGALFVKAGAIIPIWDEIDYIGQKSFSDLKFQIFSGKEGEFTLCEDDGTTYDYLEGRVLKTKISFLHSENGYYFNITSKGEYNGMPAERDFQFAIQGCNKKEDVFINETKTKRLYNEEKKEITFSFHLKR